MSVHFWETKLTNNDDGHDDDKVNHGDKNYDNDSDNDSDFSNANVSREV